MVNKKKKQVKPLLLHPSQAEVFSDSNRFKILVCGRRWGKALDLETPIFTPQGWKKMGNIKRGDQVFTPSGKAVNVVESSEVFEDRECYKVVFQNGGELVADKNHEWQIFSKPHRKFLQQQKKQPTWMGKDSGKVVTTEELKDLFFRYDASNYWAFPTTQPVQGVDKELPVDPYIFGAWLTGDYRLKGDQIKIKSDFVLKEFQYRGYSLSPKGVKNVYYCSQLRTEIKTENLEETDYIPSIYLNSSLNIRIACLQGILENKNASIKSTKLRLNLENYNLWQSVITLLSGLGQKATYGVETKKNKKGKQETNYWISFRPTKGLVPISHKRLNKKLNQNRRFEDDWLYIREIKKVRSRPVKCIQVDSPSGMFLAGKDLIPTHNSRLLLTKAISKAINFDGEYDEMSPPHVVIAMPELKQARAQHWLSLVNMMEDHPAVNRIYKSDFRISFKGRKPDIIVRGANENSGDSLRGLKIYFAGLDEFQDIKTVVWENVVRPALTDTPNSSCLITGTPKGRNSYFYYLYSKAEEWENWRSFHYFTKDNPFIDVQEIENAASVLPDRVYRQEYEASFEDFAGKIYTELSEDHLIDPEDLPKLDEYFIGIDWGDINPALVVVGIEKNYYIGFDKYYLLDYWKNPQQNPKTAVTQDEHNRQAMKRVREYGIKWGYADPSQPGRIVSLRKAGLPKLVEGYNRLGEGNGIVNILLKANLLNISKDCYEVYSEMEAYHREEEDGVIQEEVADDQEDHCCDSLRYVLATREQKRINKLLNPEITPISNLSA